MMVLDRATGRREHKIFREITEQLRPGDLLVVNDAEADLIELGGRMVPPLPPYIKRKKSTDFTEQDYQRYRTVYARTPGSKAAPTAGFHLTTGILEKLQAKGIEIAGLTLHVSYDTYKPIRSERIEDHPMHGEEFMIPVETQKAVIKARQEGRRVIAVGTTVVRALESSSSPTTLFIKPGFSFKIVDALLTNFHRPRSTVLVMVSAFVSAVAGSEGGCRLVMDAYAEAIQQGYRLFSYGDCMLIL